MRRKEKPRQKKCCRVWVFSCRAIEDSERWILVATVGRQEGRGGGRGVVPVEQWCSRAERSVRDGMHVYAKPKGVQGEAEAARSSSSERDEKHHFVFGKGRTQETSRIEEPFDS